VAEARQRLACGRRAAAAAKERRQQKRGGKGKAVARTSAAAAEATAANGSGAHSCGGGGDNSSFAIKAQSGLKGERKAHHQSLRAPVTIKTNTYKLANLRFRTKFVMLENTLL
jgi:hypothetical protein